MNLSVQIYILYLYHSKFRICIQYEFAHILKEVDIKMAEFGKVVMHLNDMIKARGISKTQLSYMAQLQRTQLNNYCNGKIVRIDFDILGRLCTALDCDICDLLEYIPPKK